MRVTAGAHYPNLKLPLRKTGRIEARFRRRMGSRLGPWENRSRVTGCASFTTVLVTAVT